MLQMDTKKKQCNRSQLTLLWLKFKNLNSECSFLCINNINMILPIKLVFNPVSLKYKKIKFSYIFDKNSSNRTPYYYKTIKLTLILTMSAVQSTTPQDKDLVSLHKSH